MERRSLIVRGTVQGVGFRPFVYRLAQRFRVSGNVRNESGVVRIEVEGRHRALDRFCRALARRPPPLAMISDILCSTVRCRGENEFHILPSTTRTSSDICVSPDIATCQDCLQELFDPAGRRYRYPFLNCTNCGPRLTIVQGAPYDRNLTTMSPFTMCAECRAEYDNPMDRRYHAQPTCCPKCGPRLRLMSNASTEITTGDPIHAFAEALRIGKIGAVKGLGGYHLVCDALNAHSIAELRRRKQRDEKPFALMVADVAQARSFAK